MILYRIIDFFFKLVYHYNDYRHRINIDDFQFNFNQLRSLYNKEPSCLKEQFEFKNIVDWLKFQKYIRENESQYFDFITDFKSYEIFPANMILDANAIKPTHNQTILSYYNNYMSIMKTNEKYSGTSLYILSHGLVNNPSRYCIKKQKK